VLRAPTSIGIVPRNAPVSGVEGIDFAGDKAEIADQQVVRELTETGWGESNAPRRGELASDDCLQQRAILGENCYGSKPRLVHFLAIELTRRRFASTILLGLVSHQELRQAA
jgi:hypothetical protein